MRLTSNELEKIKEKYGVDTLWSWSRLEKARNYLYEFYLTYIAKKREDRTDCVYGVMGGLCHEILEKLYNNELPYEDMESYFETNWTALIDVADLKFDRNDSEKNRSIAAKYKENLAHFFKNHNKISEKIATERFVVTKFADDIVFQGYIDAIRVNKNGSYDILDFKTSTKYSGSAQKEKCGQLVCYALGLSQMKNIPVKTINIEWNFLKYVTVNCTQANGTIKRRDIERREIGKSLATSAKMWLKKLGYEDEIDDYLSRMELENSIDCLPDDVKEKFSISDCYVHVEITDELIDYWKNIVIETVRDIEDKIKRYETVKVVNPDEADKIFYDSPEAIEKESYYYATLSGYSANLNIPYKMYLEKLEAKKNGAIDFGGLGSDLSLDDLFGDFQQSQEEVTDNNVSVKSDSENVKEADVEDIDLSWLE